MQVMFDTGWFAPTDTVKKNVVQSVSGKLYRANEVHSLSDDMLEQLPSNAQIRVEGKWVRKKDLAEDAELDQEFPVDEPDGADDGNDLHDEDIERAAGVQEDELRERAERFQKQVSRDTTAKKAPAKRAAPRRSRK